MAGMTTSMTPDDSVAASVTASMAALDTSALREAFVEQGSFVASDAFLPATIATRLQASARALLPRVHRNFLPGHKQGGSVSRHVIDADAPWIAALYRSDALIAALERLCGEKLQPCPSNDPHAYALYYYTREGDHIGWHYDTSYYDGRRYTLLVGVLDESSCTLEYELHTKRIDSVPKPVEAGAVRIAPGGLVFFDGDCLRHRITPARANEMRVSLTFEYVTDPGMRPWWRLISTLKDAFAYFGFRQVLKGSRTAS